MAVKLRVFEVPEVANNSRPSAIERETMQIAAEGDEARRNAKRTLEGSGVVRSLNWGPDSDGQPVLLAYVTKKGNR